MSNRQLLTNIQYIYYVIYNMKINSEQTEMANFYFPQTLNEFKTFRLLYSTIEGLWYK